MQPIIVPTSDGITSPIQERGVLGNEINPQLHALAKASANLRKHLEEKGLPVIRYEIKSDVWLAYFKQYGNHEILTTLKSLLGQRSPYVGRRLEIMISSVLDLPEREKPMFFQNIRNSYSGDAPSDCSEDEEEDDVGSDPIVEQPSVLDLKRQRIIDRLMQEDEVEDALRSYRTDPVSQAKRRVIECILAEADWLNELKEMQSE